jgi:hypothetical protein
MIIYTAKRSMVSWHSLNTQYVLEIDCTEDARERQVEKTSVRSKGGAMEVLYHRSDRQHVITFAPVRGTDLDLLIEMLDSTEAGETFQAQIYGTEAGLLNLRRTDTSYTLSPFMRVGATDKDWYQATITAIEV